MTGNLLSPPCASPTMFSDPTREQIDLLFQAGIWGLCRVPPGALVDVVDLRRAGLVEVDEEGCFRLTRSGERCVITRGGRVRTGY